MHDARYSKEALPLILGLTILIFYANKITEIRGKCVIITSLLRQL